MERLPAVDAAHASVEAATLFSAYHAAKSAHDVETWAAFFSPTMIYADATLGFYYDDLAVWRKDVEGAVHQWGDGRSYATRVLGDVTSAVLAVTDTSELFGGEIRALSAVDMVNGKIVRFVDYWDSRNFGTTTATQMRLPDAQFPSAFGEQLVATAADETMIRVADGLSGALATDDPAAAARLFSDDAVLEDLALHTQITGRLAIRRYLERSAGGLPYAAGARIVHVLGSSASGGYEWRSDARPGLRGLVAIELTSDATINRLTATWDSGRVDDSTLVDMTRWAIEPTR